MIDRDSLFQEAKSYNEEYALKISKLVLAGVPIQEVDLLMLHFVVLYRKLNGNTDYSAKPKIDNTIPKVDAPKRAAVA